MLREDRDPSLQNQLALSLSFTIAGASGSALLEEKELGSWGTQRCAQTPRARRASARARAQAQSAGCGKTRTRSWHGPRSARASPHARRCCGSSGHVTIGPPSRGAPCRLTVTQHSARAGRPQGSGPEQRLLRSLRGGPLSEQPFQLCASFFGRHVSLLAEILRRKRRRSALGTLMMKAPQGLRVPNGLPWVSMLLWAESARLLGEAKKNGTSYQVFLNPGHREPCPEYL